jgi:hypothetical protein
MEVRFDFGDEPMSERTLVKLGRRYPGTSRMTRWRWRQDPDFPVPVVINGTEYFYEDELQAYEELRRRAKRCDTAAASTSTSKPEDGGLSGPPSSFNRPALRSGAMQPLPPTPVQTDPQGSRERTALNEQQAAAHPSVKRLSAS